MKWSKSTTWCKKDNTAWKNKNINHINERQREIKPLKLCKISLYWFSSASVPPVQLQLIQHERSRSITNNRESEELLTTFLLSDHADPSSLFTASITPACPTQIQKKRCMRESVQHPQINTTKSFTTSQTLRDEQQSETRRNTSRQTPGHKRLNLCFKWCENASA